MATGSDHSKGSKRRGHASKSFIRAVFREFEPKNRNNSELAVDDICAILDYE